jgi:D-alanine-D-alanine ligase
VKPNSGGSSYGISKVMGKKDLEKAIIKAFAEDTEVLVEQFIAGTEVTCGVMRTKTDFFAFPITEIISKTKSGFFDVEAKYKKGASIEITPARISKELTKEIQTLSKNLYTMLHCKGVVRFDYIISNNEVWFLEVNTVPGMSSASIIPQQAAAKDISYKDLVSLIIETSL